MEFMSSTAYVFPVLFKSDIIESDLINIKYINILTF